MKKKVFAGIIALMAFVLAGVLSACGEKGLDVAYEDLKEDFGIKAGNESGTIVSYEKKSDTLTVIIGKNAEEVDKLFEILNEDIEDADVGNLVFMGLSNTSFKYSSGTTTYGKAPGTNSGSSSATTPGTTTPGTTTPGTTNPGSPQGNTQNNQSNGSSIAKDSEAYKSSKNQSDESDIAEKVNKNIGNLSCSKIKSLDVSDVVTSFEKDKWMKSLSKTDTLCMRQTDLSIFDRSSKKNKKRLAKLKNLWLTNGTTYYDLEGIESFSGLEEVRFTAGTTKSRKKTAKEKGFTPEFSMSGKTKEALPLYSLTRLKKLERVLIFPELKDWFPDANYYSALLAMQDFIPEIKTNVIGKKDELIAFKDIDVPGLAREMIKKESEQKAKDGDSSSASSTSPLSNESKINTTITNTLESLLRGDAYKCYVAGKKYKVKKGKPKLNGKSLVYLAYPDKGKWARKHTWNKDKFYSTLSNVLLGELKGKKVKYPSGPRDYDTFVYVYPKFSEYGRYDKGTVGYTQKTFVRVYDIKKKKKYKEVQIDSRQPARTFRYMGAPPEVRYEDIRKNKVIKYLEQL